jgi:hypothetical protein
MERLDAWLAALASPLLPLEQRPAGPSGSGGFQWAFREQTARALCVGKAVRMISGIRAALALADLGFIEECGTLLRTVSDFANEIIAVCEGHPKQEPTTVQRRFVQQYFKPIATTPEEYEAQERERWVSRDDLIAAHSRWVTETGGNPSRVRMVLRFLAHNYDKFVHGAYITAMELFSGRTQTFMLRGHEAEEKRRLYKGAVASRFHEALTALFQMATIANMPALADDIGQAIQALYSSGEPSRA